MRKPMTSPMCYSLLSIFLCLILQEPTQAIKQSYIVYLGSHAFGQNPSSVDLEIVTNSHYKLLGSYLGSIEKAKEAIFYSYNRYFNGFAAILEEEEASKIAKHPNVLSVFLNKKRKLHTTRSWSFLGLERNNGVISNHSIWRKSLGEDVIIANLDTGVWPESKSFSDEGMGPIPKRWRGICQTGNNNSDNFHCNRKLIGARYFYNSLKVDNSIEINDLVVSARDYNGHGSHTLSTAGGNFVHGVNVYGNGNRTASGGSPNARVAAYKVCWGDGFCYEADILAGFEAAISDGVDVISVSLGGNPIQDFFHDALAIGSLHAVEHNIIVVSSAGNLGPKPQTVSNTEPWVFTVAASTVDRDFTNYVLLGDKKILKGASLSEFGLPSNKMYPLIQAIDARASGIPEYHAFFCNVGTLDPKKVKGKIVVCVKYFNSGIDQGVVAAQAGAVGMILVNDEVSGNELHALPHLLPVSNVNVNDGAYIFSYINRTKSPMASISKVETELGKQPNPFVAKFSSRGPNFMAPSILKPTAPGVEIIAAFSEAVPPPGFDKGKTPYFILSGTSMSCPHVSGLVGLIKSLHPDWSPAAIKSAIMTTASTTDNTGKPMLNSSLAIATPFDYGAGHIQPNLAANPGLVYDLNKFDYLNFLCGFGSRSANRTLFFDKNYNCPKSFKIEDLNYPSITVEFDNRHSIINVTRTLTNVGPPSTYRVRLKEPQEVVVSVEPNILSFKKKGEKKVFRVTLALKSPGKYKAKYFFGGLDWTDGEHHVKSPIFVKYPSE